MKHYSRQIEMPKTRKDGLCNFVQLIINRMEEGDHREALLTAVDLLDTLSGDANPFAYITDGHDNRLAHEIRAQFEKEKAAAIDLAYKMGHDAGVEEEKRRVAKTLGLVV